MQQPRKYILPCPTFPLHKDRNSRSRNPFQSLAGSRHRRCLTEYHIHRRQIANIDNP
jgi:hypothetical protein